jgi:hypothetical protein
MTARGQGALDYLQGQARGENSVSAEQLRQALQQNLAAQRSMAASASPQNAAMAARTAAIQSGRLGAGLAGQQAVAGLAERNQAQQAYAQSLGQMRGQDLQAALGSRQTAVGANGAGQVGAPEKSLLEQYGPAVASIGGLIASDRRLKTDVEDGDAKANKMLEGLRAYSYRYKDEGDSSGASAPASWRRISSG